MIYSTILFDVKKRLDLSLREYVLLDSIFHLQTKTGWCYSKNEYFGELLDVSVREIQKIKSKLIERGLMEIEGSGKATQVRTSDVWNDIYSGNYEQKDASTTNKSSAQPRTKVHSNHEQKFAHTYNNEIDSKSNTSETQSREEDEVISSDPVDMIPLVIKEMESLDPKNKRFYGNTTQRDACKFLIEEYGFDLVVKVIHVIPSLKAQIAYMPSVTTPVELRDKWVKIKDAVEREKAKAKNKTPEVLFA